MSKVFNLENATNKGRRDCINDINIIIATSVQFDAFCAGDYLRNVLVFDDLSDCRPFTTLDLYFPDLSKVVEFIELCDNLECSGKEHVFKLIKYDYVIATIICHHIDDHQINFDIDKVIYLRNTLTKRSSYVSGNLHVPERLVYQIRSKSAYMCNKYIRKVKETADYSAYLALMRENYTISFDNCCELYVRGFECSDKQLITMFNEVVKIIAPVPNLRVVSDKTVRQQRIAELTKELHELLSLELNNN